MQAFTAFAGKCWLPMATSHAARFPSLSSIPDLTRGPPTTNLRLSVRAPSRSKPDFSVAYRRGCHFFVFCPSQLRRRCRQDKSFLLKLASPFRPGPYRRANFLSGGQLPDSDGVCANQLCRGYRRELRSCRSAWHCCFTSHSRFDNAPACRVCDRIAASCGSDHCLVCANKPCHGPPRIPAAPGLRYGATSARHGGLAWRLALFADCDSPRVVAGISAKAQRAILAARDSQCCGSGLRRLDLKFLLRGLTQCHLWHF